MDRQKRQYAIPTLDGIIGVSKEIFDEWKRAEDKERYFMIKQKREPFLYNSEKRIARFLPAREDSLDRMIEEGGEFAEEQLPVEEQAMISMLLEKLDRNLSERDKSMLYQRFFRMRTLQSLSEEVHLSRETFRDQFYELLRRCRDILENPSL